MKHLFGILLAGTAGFVCWWLLELQEGHKEKIAAAFLAVCIGLFVEIAYLLALDLRETKTVRNELRGEAEKTAAGLSSIKENQTELVRELGERIERDEDLHQLLRYQRSGYSKEEMTENWLYLLNRLRNVYWATNYIAAEQIYKTRWAKAALLIQNAKHSEKHVVMRKVFIIDDESEMVILGEHVDEQKSIGVDIHYLLHKELNEDQDILKGMREVPSIDFGIFDERLILVWELDENRSVTGGKVLHGRQEVIKHQQFFEILFHKAESFCRDRFVLVLVQSIYLENMIRTVAAWPPYDEPYKNIDYALRLRNGWLTEFGSKSVIYAAYSAGILVGFSLLVREDKKDAEFYVAIHPDHINDRKGRFGRRLTEETVRKGFQELGLTRIHLKVRTHPAHRVEIYKKAGFRQSDDKPKQFVINGENVDFFLMEMTADEYERRGT